MGPWSLWPSPGQPTALHLSGDHLWCGTRGGLVLYDLKNRRHLWWTAFHGLPSNHVTSLAVSKQDAVWIGTLEGLMRKDGDTWTRFTTGQGLVNDRVHGVAIGPDGKIWCASAEYTGGLSVFDGESWRAFRLGGKERVAVSPSNRVVTADFNYGSGLMLDGATRSKLGGVDVRKNSIAIDDVGDDAPWMRFGRGLCQEVGGKWRFLRAPGVPARAKTGPTVYDCKNARLLERNAGQWRSLSFVPERVCKTPQSQLERIVLERDREAVFFGSKSGLWRLRDGGAQDLTLRGYDNPAVVVHLSEAADGTVFAQGYEGISAVSKGGARLVKPGCSLSGAAFPHIDVRGGTRYDWAEGRVVETEVAIRGGVHHSSRALGFLGRDGTGTEWYHDYYALAFLTNGVCQLIRHGQRGGIVYAALLPRGIILSTTSGFVLVDPRTHEQRPIAPGPGRASSALATADAIWFGTRWSGLSRYSFETGGIMRWDVPGAREDKHNNMVRNIAMRNGHVFAATNGGVFEFDPETESWVRWTIEFTYAVLVDRKNNLWFGTRSGLLHYDYELAEREQLAAWALAKAETLILDLAHEGRHERERAAEALRRLGSAAHPMLLEYENHPDQGIRTWVAELLRSPERQKASVFEKDVVLYEPLPVQGTWED